MDERLDYRSTRTIRLTRALVRAFDHWRDEDVRQIGSYGLHPSEFDVLVHLGVEQPQKMMELADRNELYENLSVLPRYFLLSDVRQASEDEMERLIRTGLKVISAATT